MKGYAFYQHCCLSNLYTGILYSYSKLIDGKLKKTRNCQAKHPFVFIFIFKLNLCFYMCTSMWVTSLLSELHKNTYQGSVCIFGKCDINICDQIILLLANKMIEQFVSLDYQLFENSRDFSTLD